MFRPEIAQHRVEECKIAIALLTGPVLPSVALPLRIGEPPWRRQALHVNHQRSGPCPMEGLAPRRLLHGSAVPVKRKHQRNRLRPRFRRGMHQSFAFQVSHGPLPPAQVFRRADIAMPISQTAIHLGHRRIVFITPAKLVHSSGAVHPRDARSRSPFRSLACSGDYRAPGRSTAGALAVVSYRWVTVVTLPHPVAGSNTASACIRSSRSRAAEG